MPVPRRRGVLRGPFARIAHTSHGQPVILPIAVTIPATNVGSTYATLPGSINPQGQSGTWWFVYGRTPTYGTTTTPTAFSASSFPITVSYEATGLIMGDEYYYSVVVKTAGGTVYGGAQTFVASVPNPVPTPADAIVPVGVPTVGVPHFAFPYQVVSNSAQSGALVVEQDSLEEIQACVAAILVCPQAACPEMPDFGYPDLTFQQAPPNPNSLISAVRSIEPRAEVTTITQALDMLGSQWQIQANSTTSGTGQ